MAYNMYTPYGVRPGGLVNVNQPRPVGDSSLSDGEAVVKFLDDSGAAVSESVEDGRTLSGQLNIGSEITDLAFKVLRDQRARLGESLQASAINQVTNVAVRRPVVSIPEVPDIAPPVGMPIAPEQAGGLVGRLKRRLSFSPLRVRIYSRATDGPVNLSKIVQNTDGLGKLNLLKGRYVLTFNIPTVQSPPFLELDNPIPVEVEGKKVILEKALIEPEAGVMMLQVNLIENPIPILILIAAAGVGLGVAGWGLSESLDSVDRVVVSTTDTVIKLAVLAGGGFLVWKYVIKR